MNEQSSTQVIQRVPPSDDIAGYRDAIVRAASDKDFDLDKFERLIALQEARDLRAADLDFNIALANAQAEVQTIKADATNPQLVTRGRQYRYASYAQLDREIRPIYTKYGFAVSFTTEPASDPNTIMVVGMLSNGPILRRYQLPVPIDTKGPKGTDHMTRTHATMSAASYGKRGLLTLMFNLATDDAADDDGNRAGGKAPIPRGAATPPTEPAKAPPVPLGKVKEHVDETTGETTLAVEPFLVDWLPADTARSWGMKLIACLREYCNTAAEVAAFVEANDKWVEHMAVTAEGTHRLLLQSITTVSKMHEEANA